MVTINVKPDCDNSPKKAFLRDFEIGFTSKNPEEILSRIDDNIYWEMVGDKVINGKTEAATMLITMLDGTIQELTLDNIITHGDTGSVNGSMVFTDGTKFAFCDVFIFTSHAIDAKIKGIYSYIIKIKKD